MAAEDVKPVEPGLDSGSDQEVEDTDGDGNHSDEVNDADTKKQRFVLQEMFHKHSVLADADDSENEAGTQQYEKDPFITGGPLSDIRPVNNDPEGQSGYRCRHCPDKVLQSDQDVLNHLQSKFHKKSFRKARRDLMSEKDIQKKQAKRKRKVERRKAIASEKFAQKRQKQKEKRKEKLKSLSKEEIERRKEKSRAKKERRTKRKQET